ncbi:hypothetical protein ACTXMZ_17060 [Brachybacterium alimentarium]|uniref:hypothetical protein n=1 Tax=Brachybacterium alimentarium TaxID=47845 RepID=UPI003FCF74B8
MSNETPCNVEDCKMPGTDLFVLNRWGRAREMMVCKFHRQILDEEENIEVAEDGSLRTGSQATGEVLNVRYSNSEARGKIITLVLGHEGVEVGELELRVTPTLVDALQNERLVKFLSED